MKLDKFFTPEEVQFIREYANQHQIKEDEAVIALAREMIGTYSLKYVNGQVVLTMLDLLAMKMPMWMNLQLGALRQSYMSIRSTAQSIKNLEHPTLWEELVSLLKDPELSKQAQGFISTITNTVQSLLSPGKKLETTEDTTEENNEDSDTFL